MILDYVLPHCELYEYAGGVERLQVDAVGFSSSCEGMHEERLAGQVMFFGILAGCSWNMKLDLH